MTEEPEPSEDEVLGVVVERLGDNRLKVDCTDDVERLTRIPGGMRGDVWVSEGDVVAVEPWDWQPERADLRRKYSREDVERLRERDLL
ncbi:MAG: translation initiation factor 1A [Halobacteriota archaeon]